MEIQGFTNHPKQAGPPTGNGWTIEVHGYTYHRHDVLQLLHICHLKQPKRHKEFIIEFQWTSQPVPVDRKYQQVKGTYQADLSAFWKQFKGRIQVEAVEACYVDDLRAFYKKLNKR